MNILVISASGGMGHIKAANAIADALVSQHCPVTHIDALNYTTSLFRNLYSKYYVKAVNKFPESFSWIYNKFNKPSKCKGIKSFIDSINSQPLVEFLQTHTYDAIICTHFLPAQIVERLGINIPHFIVVTDFDAHGQWICSATSTYFVATDEIKFYLMACGIKSENVVVSGIPIDKEFGTGFTAYKNPTMTKSGICYYADSIPSITVCAGGLGLGKLKQIVEETLKSQIPQRINIVCGKNDGLTQYLNNQYKNNARINVFGFTNEMPRLLKHSDLIVGKPGGITTAEALTTMTPFVIINPIPGQEEKNSDWLLENGVAVKCNSVKLLPYKIDKLLGNKLELHRMRQNILKLAKPEASNEIANYVVYR